MLSQLFLPPKAGRQCRLDTKFLFQRTGFPVSMLLDENMASTTLYFMLAQSAKFL